MQKCPSSRKMSDSSQSWIIRIWPLSPSCVPVLFCTASSCHAIFIIFHKLLHNCICIIMIYLKICTVSNKFCVKLPQLSRLLKIIVDNNSWMLCLQLRDQTAVFSPQCPSTMGGASGQEHVWAQAWQGVCTLNYSLRVKLPTHLTWAGHHFDTKDGSKQIVMSTKQDMINRKILNWLV